MLNRFNKIFGVLTIFILCSCATSMSPLEVNNTLPLMTKSKFVSQLQAEELTLNGSCRYLVRNRKYVATIGFTAKDDLRNGAKGIDEWVTLDGGNAYVLRNFQWISVGDKGATELHLEFDTLRCE
ncbi:hypothetical protein ACLI1A_18810 [Flavobacterium sp. RHBU_3]|uniref:hypothetical protein n=1 Tax=Flavobacterium sp. RHBU_3 TaxID=3391184 RepID=UPI00398544CB